MVHLYESMKIGYGTLQWSAEISEPDIKQSNKFLDSILSLLSIVFAIGLFFTFSSIQYYTEVGRLNPNISLVAVGTLLIGVILAVTAILLYSLVSVVREGKAR